MLTMSKAKGGPPPSLIGQAVDLAVLPIRIAVSPLARRAYLSTFLLFVASGVLLFLSAVAYILFYHAYVPHAAISVPIYLQYAHDTPGTFSSSGSGDPPSYVAKHHPFGTALLTPALSADQRYDVEVVLEMPRSPANTGAGNFMVDLALLVSTDERPGAAAGAGAAAGMGMPDAESTVLGAEVEAVVARARRPALLTWTSAQVELARRAVALPWYAAGWARESEAVEVLMLEEVEFGTAPRTRKLRGGAGGSLGVPDRVRVTLEARHALEVYSARVEIRARLRGLRWLMYKHWLLSFVLFTGGFYAATMGSAVAVYVGLTVRQVMREQASDEDAAAAAAAIAIASEEEDDDGQRLGIKQEPSRHLGDDPELSDTPRTFPTRHGREPLIYTGRGRQRSRDENVEIKKEDVEASPSLVRALEADDEGDGDDYEDAGVESFRDSGIGTGREERDPASARRRKRASG